MIRFVRFICHQNTEQSARRSHRKCGRKRFRAHTIVPFVKLFLHRGQVISSSRRSHELKAGTLKHGPCLPPLKQTRGSLSVKDQGGNEYSSRSPYSRKNLRNEYRYEPTRFSSSSGQRHSCTSPAHGGEMNTTRCPEGYS